MASIIGRAVGVVASLVVAVVVVLAGSSPANAATGLANAGSFSSLGTDPGQLTNPQRVAVEQSTGRSVVADQGNDRVQVFAANRSFLAQFGDAVSTDDPYGVAVDQASGDVYVSSSVSKTITRWQSDGAPVPTYTQDMGFISPSKCPDAPDPCGDGQVGSFNAALAVDPSTGDLLVADPGDPNVGDPANNKISRYDATGTWQSSFRGEDSGTAFSQLKDIAVNAAGTTYVVDAARIARFDTSDAFVDTLDPPGGAPALVAVDPVGGDAVVATNFDDQCAGSPDRLVSYDGTTPESQSDSLPSVGDCTFPSGLAFDAAGRLFVAVTGAFGGCCGGSTAIQYFDKTTALADAASDAATDVEQFSVTLQGRVNPRGTGTRYRFETSTDGLNWSPAGAEQGPIGGAFDIPVESDITGLTDGTQYYFRLVAFRPGSGIATLSPVQTFTSVDVDAPAVTLDATSGIMSDSATLNGRVDAHGVPTTYRFEYSGDGGNSYTILPGPDDNPDADDSAGSGNGDTNVTASLTGLDPSKQYLIRLVATNGGGSNQADDQLTTAGSTAVVSDPVATSVEATSARLGATVESKNAETTWLIEYGTDTTYSTTTAARTLAANAAAARVGQTITGLEPATTYHFKIVADNGTGGPQHSADQTFTTAQLPPTPAIGAVSDVTRTAVTLAGTVDTHGVAGTAHFAIVQTDGTYSDATTPVDLNATSGPQSVTANVAGLPAAASFRARVSAETSGGLRFSETVQFSTPPPPGFSPAPAPADNGDSYSSLPQQPSPSGVKPSNVFTATSKVNGTAVTITVGVPGAGALKVTGNRLTTVSKKAQAKGNVALKLKLTKTGRAALHKAKSRQVRVRVTIRFTPTGGEARSATRTITFHRKGGK